MAIFLDHLGISYYLSPMGKIKSAIELAMEKTADLKTDKKAIKKNMILREGKVSATKHINEPSRGNIKEQLLSYNDKEEQEWFREGAMDTILANLTLPRLEADLQKLPALQSAMTSLSDDEAESEDLFSQLTKLFQQYLGNIDQLEDALKQQYEPQLRQKEMQMRQQTGQEVTLTAETDPEFLKILADQMSKMDQQYNGILKQVKEELRKPAS